MFYTTLDHADGAAQDIRQGSDFSPLDNSTSPSGDNGVFSEIRNSVHQPGEGSLAEFRASAIPDRLTRLNIEFVGPDDDRLLQYLTEHEIANAQKSTSFVGRPAQRIMDRYLPNALHGGWVAWGATIDGGHGQVPYAKLRNPRSAYSKGFGKPGKIKTVKYEGAADCPALPILPFVDDETAQAIYDRYNVTPLPGEAFWRCVWRCGLPIVITEGLKKALCLLAHGYPAIALRGVACWHPKDDKTVLHQAIADFATLGRPIYIAYDKDSKPRTIANVNRQIAGLGKRLELNGCNVSVLDWCESEGKGIDDAIYNAGENGQGWLDAVVLGAVPFADFKKMDFMAKLMAAIDRAKTITQTPDRDTTGGYLDPIDVATVADKITVISAPTGCGKSTAIAKLATDWRETTGGRVLYLLPLNSVGQQNARAADLPHIHEYAGAGDTALFADIAHRGGLASCFDSLHRVPGWFWDKPVLLILDEVNQGLDHLVIGGTLGARHAEIVEAFAAASTKSAAIVVAEAKVYPMSVNYAKQVSGKADVQYIRHDRPVERGTVEISKSGRLSGLVAEAVVQVSSGKKVIIAATSLVATRKIHRFFDGHFPGKTVVRIDSQTNRDGEFDRFFDSPDDELERLRPDILILSPSAKTGVSITWPGFDAVFGYFPALDPDSWLQMLTRYRLPVPRYVYAVPFVSTKGDESLLCDSVIKKRQTAQRAAFANHFEVEAIAESSGVAMATIEYAAASAALRGQQKAIAYDCLVKSLTNEGFSVIEVDRASDREVGELLAEAQTEIDHDDAGALAASGVCESIRLAHETLAKSCSLADELMARKTLLREEFPGITFDHADENYWLVCQQRGQMRRGIRNQAFAENAAAATGHDRAAALAALASGLTHTLPKTVYKSALLRAIGILELAELGDGELTNHSEICKSIQARALHRAPELKYYFGYQVMPEYTDEAGKRRHSPIDVCSKLLGAFGLKMVDLARPGTKGNRDRVYTVGLKIPARVDAAGRVAAMAIRARALAACRERLALSVASAATATAPVVESVAEVVAPVASVAAVDAYGYAIDDWAGDCMIDPDNLAA